MENGLVRSEEDEALQVSNKKWTVTTNAQVQAWEKFYYEPKYPMEPMKLQIAEKIVCHQSINDKRLTFMDHHESSGVIQQDHISGQRQDFCGSVKQAGYKNLDTKEVESGKLTLHEKYYSVDTPSGINSYLRNMPNHQKRNLVLKFSTGSKIPRPSPAGYLKVKSQVERTAISAIRRQLGKYYREKGPLLGVAFDSLPPGAFEETIQNPDDGETCYTVDTASPASPDFSKIHQHPKFGKGYEYNSNAGSDIGGDYGMRYIKGPEISRTGSFSSTRYLQPFSDNFRLKTIENTTSNLTAKDIVVYHNSFDPTQPRQIAEDGKVYANGRMENENQIMVPYENDDIYVRKRMRHKSPQHPHLKKSSMVDNQLRTCQVARSVSAMRFEFSEDKTSVKTSSSVE